MSEIELLRQEIAALRQKVSETDDWASGIQQALIAVLPFLLRGHPDVGKIEGVLRHYSERYDELLADPLQAETPDATAGVYEAGAALYRQLAILGVWPGIDPAAAAQQTLARQAVALPRG